jgi:hypothetical protein
MSASHREVGECDVLVMFSHSGYRRLMLDPADEKLTPVDPDDLAAALALRAEIRGVKAPA